ncbi:MAG: SRPBCC family protein [Propionicimonas sp.]
MATTTYSVSRNIQAPPQVIWDLLTDPSSYRDWNPAVLSIEGAMSPGGTIKLVSIASPQRTFSLTVTSMQAPVRMVWSDGMPLGLFRGVRTYQLDPIGAGTTFAMTEEFSGPLAGLITKSIPDLTDSFNQFADGLRAAAERAAHT